MLRANIRGPRAVPSVSVTAGTDDRVEPDELESWRTFLRAHARISRTLEAELLADQRISLAAYDVLVQLVEAPDQRLRMTELADSVLLSRSGVTRLVDRLERDGLVARSRVVADGRGVVATLTEAGFRRLRVATKTHLNGVKRHFVDVLAFAERSGLRDSCRKLADAQSNGGDLDALREQPLTTADPTRTATTVE